MHKYIYTTVFVALSITDTSSVPELGTYTSSLTGLNTSPPGFESNRYCCNAIVCKSSLFYYYSI